MWVKWLGTVPTADLWLIPGVEEVRKREGTRGEEETSGAREREEHFHCQISCWRLGLEGRPGGKEQEAGEGREREGILAS